MASSAHAAALLLADLFRPHGCGFLRRRHRQGPRHSEPHDGRAQPEPAIPLRVLDAGPRHGGLVQLAFLDQIPHETLVIIGDDDPLIPLANAEVLSQKIPRARLEVVERAGHLFLWDEAERLADRVGQFVNAAVQPSSDSEGPLPAAPPPPAPTKRRAGLAARRALGPMLPA